MTKSVGLSIGALAKTAGVNVETIRFYQRKGLLSRPKRTDGEMARYSAEDVRQVKFVKAAKQLGFTLDEILVLLRLEDGTHCDEARDMAVVKLGDVRRRLAALHKMESTLEHVIAGCCASTDKAFCPLIASLRDHDRSASITGTGNRASCRARHQAAAT